MEFLGISSTTASALSHVQKSPGSKSSKLGEGISGGGGAGCRAVQMVLGCPRNGKPEEARV